MSCSSCTTDSMMMRQGDACFKNITILNIHKRILFAAHFIALADDFTKELRQQKKKLPRIQTLHFFLCIYTNVYIYASYVLSHKICHHDHHHLGITLRYVRDIHSTLHNLTLSYYYYSTRGNSVLLSVVVVEYCLRNKINKTGKQVCYTYTDRCGCAAL